MRTDGCLRWSLSWARLVLPYAQRIMVMALSTSHHTIKATVALVLPSVGSYVVWIWRSHLWHNVHTKFNENPSRHSLVITCALKDITGEGIRFGKVSLGQVGLVVRMRRRSCVTTTSSFYLTTLNIRQVGITECRKLKSISLEQSATA
jgi:hypothetical protein